MFHKILYRLIYRILYLNLVYTLIMPTSELFPDIIGQTKAKQKLNFYRDGFNSTNVPS